MAQTTIPQETESVKAELESNDDINVVSVIVSDDRSIRLTGQDVLRHCVDTCHSYGLHPEIQYHHVGDGLEQVEFSI